MAAQLNDLTLAFMREKAEKGFDAPYVKFSIAEARERSRAVTQYFGGEFSFDGDSDEVFVPSPNVQGGIPVSVYTPRGLSDKPAILVYFHGGGWVVGCRENYTIICQKMATGARCIVLNVEYRLAPEHKFPACNDDARDVMQWVIQNRTRVGGHVSSVVGVAGDSAGGLISATVCYEVPGIRFQILVYPKVDTRLDRPSNKEFPEGPILPRELLVWFHDQWLLPENHDDVRANPMVRQFQGPLPPALFIVAECDPIRDDSYDYEQRLKDSGIGTRLLLIKGACHGFFGLSGFFVKDCDRAVETVAEFIEHYSKAD